MPKRKPILFVLCGPSGSGKSTVARDLIANCPDLNLSISTTTRPPRKNEVDGREYYFVSRAEFEQRISKGEFIESAEFNGNLYGTGTNNVNAAEEQGKDLLFDIEVQGVLQLKKRYGDSVVTIFVFPPTFAELKKRLSGRGTESSEVIQSRLGIAEREVAQLRSPEFSDYFLITGHPQRTLERAQSIITVERMRLKHVSPELLAKCLDRKENKPD